MENKLIVANFKMNKTNLEIMEYYSELPEVSGEYRNTIVFCPPSTSLYFMSNLTSHPKIRLGVQNIHYEDSGAFTGEISAKMVTECGAEFVIIGHSERKNHFHEDDDIINRKVKTAIENGLTVILCIGETEKQRQAGHTDDILSKQILSATKGIDYLDKLVVAYEPVWAIGGDNSASPEQISEIAGNFHANYPDIPFLYGGSVNEENAGEIMSIRGVDGVLVGGACLSPKKFAKICGII
jgi:triosephosphate isomerase